jgi:hypothetical protein
MKEPRWGGSGTIEVRAEAAIMRELIPTIMVNTLFVSIDL